MTGQASSHRGRIRGMKFRELRIASSVFCGVCCVLMIVLWVRQNRHPPYVPADIPGEPIPKLVIPLLFGFFVAGTLAGAYPILLELRFSVRTLLITTTLVAVVLGLIVWLTH